MSDSVPIRITAMDARLDAKSINSIVRAALEKKAETVTHDPALRQAVGGIFIEIVSPLVPLKTGNLRSSAFAESDGRVDWPAPYAGFVYYHAPFKHPTTSGTVPYWVENVDYDAFISAVTPLIISAFRKDGTLRTGPVHIAQMKAAYAGAKRRLRAAAKQQVRLNASSHKKGKKK